MVESLTLWEKKLGLNVTLSPRLKFNKLKLIFLI